MDTSDAKISFDSEGVCNRCTNYLSGIASARVVDRHDELTHLVERMKRVGRSRKYDCVVGVSGGGDSTYTAYLASSLGLRVLAVHLDNGWDTALSVKNVKRLVEKLKLDYTSFVVDWEEFKDVQLSFIKASTLEIESASDMAIVGALYQVAAAHNVKYIVTGGNIWTEGILPKDWQYNAKDAKYLTALHRQFGQQRELRSFPIFGYREEIYYKFIKRIRTVYPLLYVPYSPHEVEALLKREFDWERPAGKHQESTITRFVHCYVIPSKFKIDYRRATLSTRICTGDITRERALEELKEPPFDPVQVELDKRYIAKKFGITIRELNAFLALPAKSYHDYPNDKRVYEGLTRLYWTFVRKDPRARLED